jgi:hypothetical protein
MAIKEVGGGNGNNILVPQKADTTVTKDTFGVFDANGLAIAAPSTATYVDFIFRQTQTADSGETPDVNVQLLTGSEWLICDCTNNTAQTHIGNQHDLTDAATLANAASDGTYKAIKAYSIIGATTDKKLLCKAVQRAA